MGRNSHPAALGAQSGNQCCCPALSVPSAASSHAGELFPVLQSFPEHLTQEANWG